MIRRYLGGNDRNLLWKLLYSRDNAEALLGWVDRNHQAPQSLIILDFKDGELDGYLISGLGQMFDQTTSFEILDVYKEGMLENGVFEQVIKWAKDHGAKRINAISKRSKPICRKYKFKEVGTLISMEV